MKKQEEKGTNDNFRFLAFKLDFNEFYKLGWSKFNHQEVDFEEEQTKHNFSNDILSNLNQ